MTSCPLWCKSWPRKFILDVGNRSCVFYFFGFVYFKFLYSEETWYQFIFAIILDHCWTGHLAYRTFEQWAGRSFGPNVLLFIYYFFFFWLAQYSFDTGLAQSQPRPPPPWASLSINQSIMPWTACKKFKWRQIERRKSNKTFRQILPKSAKLTNSSWSL